MEYYLYHVISGVKLIWLVGILIFMVASIVVCGDLVAFNSESDNHWSSIAMIVSPISQIVE